MVGGIVGVAAGRALRCMLLVGLFGVASTAAHAAVLTGQGTWYGTDGTDGTLRGRDALGNPVNLLNAAGTAPNLDLKYVYDVDRNLTWLADWNVNGAGTWSQANTWAMGLTDFGGGWRLPSALNADGTGPCGAGNCTGSEMGHLWYTDLGNTYFAFTNTGPFIDMQSGDPYWSGTEYAPSFNPPTTYAWAFNIINGVQGPIVQDVPLLYAVAVRSGDVFAGSVPEPGSLAMLLAGWWALVVARRGRTH